MKDLKEYLEEKKLILTIKEELSKPKNVVQSRNRLLAMVKGSIRKHLQTQIVEEIQKFRKEGKPDNPNRII